MEGLFWGGSTTWDGYGDFDFWLVKTDSDGNFQFEGIYGESGSDSVSSLVRTADGYLLVGTKGGYGMKSSDGWVVKTDLCGNMLWNKSFGKYLEADRFSAATVGDEGYIVAGIFNSGDNSMAVVIKLDLAGEIVWEVRFDSDDAPMSLVKCREGGVVFAGTKTEGRARVNVWLVKIAAELDFVPPRVAVFSPWNGSFLTGDVRLIFRVNEDVDWVGYSLDGDSNITVEGDVILAGLSDGGHNIRVYARDFAGNVGASDAYFTITKPEPFIAPWIAAAAVIVAVVSLGVLFYFKKRKH
jgi:hypothetical protein